MAQGFTKREFAGTQSTPDLCRMVSGTTTITGGGGDITIDLPIDWIGGTLEIHLSDSTSKYVLDASKHMSFTTSYDALTNSAYTSNEVIGQYYLQGTNGFPFHENTGTNLPGLPKSATANSFTLNDSGATVYVKYFIYAPYTAKILEGVGAKYASGVVTVTGGGGDVTVDLPFDWTGGFLEVHYSDAAANYLQPSATSTFRTSYEALTNAAYTDRQLLEEATNNGGNWATIKSVNRRCAPKSATTTSFTLDDDGTTAYAKWFVWA